MAPFVGDLDPLDPRNTGRDEQSGGGTRLWVLVVVVALLLSLGGAWYVWHRDQGASGPVPVIQAPQGAHKVAPSGPDHDVVPFQDKTVYERIQPRQNEHLTPDILQGKPDAAGRTIVNRGAPVPVTEGLRTYTPPPPGLPPVGGAEASSAVTGVSGATGDDDSDDDDDDSDDDEGGAAPPHPLKEGKSEEPGATGAVLPSPAPRPLDPRVAASANRAVPVPSVPVVRKAAPVPGPVAVRGKSAGAQVSGVRPGVKKPRYRLQIASTPTRKGADAEWKRLSPLSGQLRKLSHQVVSVDLGEERGVRYRLYVGGWSAYAEAAKVRAALARAGVVSVIVQP
jgi:hypothetical protein